MATACAPPPACAAAPSTHAPWPRLSWPRALLEAEYAARGAELDAMMADLVPLAELARRFAMAEVNWEAGAAAAAAARAAAQPPRDTDAACARDCDANCAAAEAWLSDACGACEAELLRSGSGAHDELEPGALGFLAMDAAGVHAARGEGDGGYETEGDVQDAGNTAGDSDEHAMLCTTPAAKAAPLLAGIAAAALPAPEEQQRTSAVQPAAAPRSRGAARANKRRAAGGSVRWREAEDTELLDAVDANRCGVDRRNPAGISWAAICCSAFAGRYPLLRPRLTAQDTRVLQKRYFQYLRPEEQLNKARVWR